MPNFVQFRRSCAVVASLFFVIQFLLGSDWESRLVRYPAYLTIKAPHGHLVLSAPSPSAKPLKTVSEAGIVTAAGHVDVGTDRFYISDWSWERWRSAKHPPNWVKIRRDPNVVNSPANSPEEHASGPAFRLQPQFSPGQVDTIYFSQDERLAITLGEGGLYPTTCTVCVWSMQSSRVLWMRHFDLGRSKDAYQFGHVEFLGFLRGSAPVVLWRNVSSPSFTTVEILEPGSGTTEISIPILDGNKAQISVDGDFVGEFNSNGDLATVYSTNGARTHPSPPGLTFQIPKSGNWVEGESAIRGKSPSGRPRTISVDPEGVTAHEADRVLWRTNWNAHSSAENLKGSEARATVMPPWDEHPAWIGQERTWAWSWFTGSIFIVNASHGKTFPIVGRATEGDLGLASSPSGRLFLTSSVVKDTAAEDPAGQFFGELLLHDDKIERSPWPNQGRTLAPYGFSLVADRYLVCTHRFDTNSDELNSIYVLDLQEMRLVWKRSGGGEVGSDFSISGSILFTSELTKENANRSLGYNIHTGERVPVPEDFNWDALRSANQRFVRPDPTVMEKIGLSLVDESEWGSTWIDAEGGRYWVNRCYLPSHDLLVLSSRHGASLHRPSKGFSAEFIVEDGDSDAWVLAAPDGYFTASEDGAKLMGVTMGTESYRIDQFATRWNRPDILIERFGFADPVHLDSLREKVRRREAKNPPLNLEKFSPPFAAIEESRQDRTDLVLTIVGTAQGSDLISLQIYVNGCPHFPGKGQSVSGRAVRQVARVPLESGQNRIEVSFVDASGLESPRAFLQSTLVTEQERDLYFLGVGVSEYHHPAFSDLDYAARDALDLAQAVKSLGGFREVHTKILTDQDVTSDALGEISAWLARSRVQDHMILFVAGHGVNVEGTYYFLPSTAHLDRITSTGIPFSSFEEILRTIPSRNKLFLIDTCESGESPAVGSKLGSRVVPSQKLPRGITARDAFNRGSLAEPRDGNHSGARLLLEADLRRNTGAVIFASCEWHESALESPIWENGAFTEALIEALTSGAADSSGDGILGKKELRDYVRARVSGLTDGFQNPTIDLDNSDEGLDFLLGEVAQGEQPSFWRTSSGLVWGPHTWGKAGLEWSGGTNDSNYSDGHGILKVTYPDGSTESFGGVIRRGRFDGTIDYQGPGGIARSELWADGKLIRILQ